MSIRKQGWAGIALASTVLFHCGAAQARQAGDNLVPRAVAEQLVNQTIKLVETEGLPPTEQASYDAAKASLTAMLRQDAETFDRRTLYASVNRLLHTLDADRHSSLRTTRRSSTGMYTMPPSPPIDKATIVRTIDTAGGKVMHFTPPQVVGGGPQVTTAYVSTVLQALNDSKAAAGSCALVIDLSAQRGGNAWPPMVTLRPLLSDQNTARFVTRSGDRQPLFTMQGMAHLNDAHASGLDNPLSRFKGQPIAFIIARSTASAGEMLSIALLGEKGSSFGWSTAGLTTANRSFPMPDEAHLLLSVSRYALADAAPIRGVIAPMRPAEAGATQDEVLRTAASWAASQSALCSQHVGTAKAGPAAAPAR